MDSPTASWIPVLPDEEGPARARERFLALDSVEPDQVREAILASWWRSRELHELVLFQSYLQTCRRTTGIVMAFNKDIVMMNDSARRLIDPADQSMLLGRANQELSDSRRARATVTLSSGSKVRMYCRRVDGHREGDIAGGVLSVKLLETEESTVTSAPILPMFLPGVVGSAPLWLRCGHQVDAGFSRREWLVLAGEPGAGKYTLVRGVHQRRNPAGRLHALDAARAPATWHDDLRRELIDDPADTLVIRRADRLSEGGLAALTAVLREVRGGPNPPWVALTVSPDAETGSELLSFFPRTVSVSPLRRHAEDLGDLVPLFLSRLSGNRLSGSPSGSPSGTAQLTCSPAAMHLLSRASWPGNVAQLYRVLKYVTKRRRTGIIQPADLPAEYRAINRRPLNRFETVERDAIVRGLEDADGNKARAAKLLGISRATIYRKIHEYGIVTPGGP